MTFYADLHIHSKHSRATSRDCDLENLSYWGQKKGIRVIGTGDFTHPAWFQEIQEKLIPAEPGLFRLKPDIEKSVSQKLPSSCQAPVRFMLSVEVSTIYKKDDKVRKIHHLIYAPDFLKAQKIRQALEKIGNIKSDGRPILGLDSRHLLEIVLNAGSDCYLVPAHIWTPWFAVLGSKSGFDCVDHCYGDLAPHVFAVETGLSSDPEMNWRVSSLDRYRLMSNSDAHSPQKLGREVNVFHTSLDYYSMLSALKTGSGFGGTLEFFPEEGKYHLDGHRACGVRLEPEESRKYNGVCPKCAKPLTLGVLYRVEELADRPHSHKPEGACAYRSVIPLPEVISEITRSGVTSQTVSRQYELFVSRLGNELDILSSVPLDTIQKSSSQLFAEAVNRMRQGKVIREGGYDGEYGRIKLFSEQEIHQHGKGTVLFDVDIPIFEKSRPKPAASKISKNESDNTSEKKRTPSDHGIKSQGAFRIRNTSPNMPLDPFQSKALDILAGPLCIVAGPGAGKTRTLTHRIKAVIDSGKAEPDECLALTFTRRAANEMKEKLIKLSGLSAKAIPVMTFHSLGLLLLQECRQAAGLPRGFRVVSEAERFDYLKSVLSLTDTKIQASLKSLSLWKRTLDQPQHVQSLSDDAKKVRLKLAECRETNGWIDYDDLILDSLKVLEDSTALQAKYRSRFPYISVDEFQDLDEAQYRLLKLLSGSHGNLCVIGDPDQSIYRFRGACPNIFRRFLSDYPQAKELILNRNYRSGTILSQASNQIIAPQSLVEDRFMEGLLEDPGKILIHESPSDKSEAEFTARSIEKMIGGLSFYSIDTGRSDTAVEKDFSFKDFAILYRSDQQALLVEEALSHSGIPFERRSQNPMSSNLTAQAYLNSLRAAPADETLLDTLQAARKRIEAQPSSVSAEERDAVYSRLEAIALKANERKDVFLSEFYLSEDLELLDGRADRVSLMTLHAAKGLEFPVVFIVGCEDGLIPLRFGSEISAEQMAEERRLFYVGMTRAKERLVLSYAAKRFTQGKVKEQSVSPFLKDIETQLLQQSRTVFKPRLKDPQMDLF